LKLSERIGTSLDSDPFQANITLSGTCDKAEATTDERDASTPVPRAITADRHSQHVSRIGHHALMRARAMGLTTLSIAATMLFSGCGSSGSIAATGKIISVSKLAGAEVVCVRDARRLGIPVCGVSPHHSTAERWQVGACAHIRVTDHTFDLKLHDC
jgi:hypothetical protein